VHHVNPGAAQAAVSSCADVNSSLFLLSPSLAELQFIGSPSYQRVQSAQRDAVFLMYTITLNRPTDSGGFTFWLNTMTQNNYGDLWLAAAFVIRPDFQDRLESMVLPGAHRALERCLDGGPNVESSRGGSCGRSCPMLEC
jgi:hypothetical protein